MYSVNQKIIDTFEVTKPDNSLVPIAGLSFTPFLWIDGVPSALSAAIAVSELVSPPVGIYTLEYTPSSTGSHHISLSSTSAVLDADYYVTANLTDALSSVTASNISQITSAVWTDSGTSVLNSISSSTNNQAVAQAVWGYSTSGTSVSAGSFGEALSATYQVQIGKWEMAANQLKLYDKDGVTVLKTFNLFDLPGNPSLTGVVKRVPA